ncbi:MAG: holo-[acyl-carrier-protein] synthase [Lentisphaerae bacterium GWF2_52_8]|nr:MAG: holo-[acyl-carrier-protein] synthase [Lentisphaerae bacterium GWF2_52_8]
MILGIGTDIVEIERFRRLIERHGDLFLSRIFSEEERSEAASRRDPAPYFAGRWAAKEAFSKALGCGIGAKCAWLELMVCNNASGKPEMKCQGQAAKTGTALGLRSIHLSISHEKNSACAMVVLES